jgi:hypothetical protein
MTLCLLFLERYSCSGEGGGRSTHPRKGCRTSTSVQLARRSREIFSRYMRRCRSLTRRVKSSPGVHATRECPLRSSLSDRVGARVGVPFTRVGLSHRTRGPARVPWDPPDACGDAVGLTASSDVAPHGTPSCPRRGANAARAAPSSALTPGSRSRAGLRRLARPQAVRDACGEHVGEPR